MKYKDILLKQKGDIPSILAERTAHLSELRFLNAQGKVKNVRDIRQTRKDIARLKTYIKNAL